MRRVRVAIVFVDLEVGGGPLLGLHQCEPARTTLVPDLKLGNLDATNQTLTDIQHLRH